MNFGFGQAADTASGRTVYAPLATVSCRQRPQDRLFYSSEPVPALLLIPYSVCPLLSPALPASNARVQRIPRGGPAANAPHPGCSAVFSSYSTAAAATNPLDRSAATAIAAAATSSAPPSAP